MPVAGLILFALVASTTRSGEANADSVASGSKPSWSQRRDALDELQGSLGQWQRERREFNRERARSREIRARREAPQGAGEAVAPSPGSRARPAPRREWGKVIEVAPEDPPRDASAWGEVPQGATEVERQVLKLEEELEARRRSCDEDPGACEAERERRRIIREGNAAWDAALQEKQRAKEAAIEAEALRIQQEIDVARRREAEQRARDLGGRLDEKGEFVDDDLTRER